MTGNCGECKRFQKDDSYCEVLKMVVFNPSWQKPCVEKDEDSLLETS